MQNNVGLRAAALFKKKTLAHVFSCEFGENFRDNFFTKHPQRTASENGYSSK